MNSLLDIYWDDAANCYSLCRYVDIPKPSRQNHQYSAIRVWGRFVTVSAAEMEARGRNLVLADLREYLTRDPELNPRGPLPWDQIQLLKDAGLTGLKQIRIMLDYPQVGQLCIAPSHFLPGEEVYEYRDEERIILPVTCGNEAFAKAVREAFTLSTHGDVATR